MKIFPEDDYIECPAIMSGQLVGQGEAEAPPDDPEHNPVEGQDPEYRRLTEEGLREAREKATRQQPQVAPGLAKPQAPTGSAATPPPDLVAAAMTAEKVQELSCAGFLFGVTGKLYPGADILPFKIYLDNFLESAGIPSDPIERMLLEQLALAHHAMGRLHVRAGMRENMDEVSACHAAVARLMGEFRRHALGLQEYREASAKRTKSKPERQPVATKSTPEKNGTASNGAHLNGTKKSCDTEVVSNGRLTEFFHERKPEPALT